MKKTILSLILILPYWFSASAMAQSVNRCLMPTNTPSQESEIQRAAYYANNDQIVIRFLQRGEYFNFETCTGDSPQFQIETFNQFKSSQCQLLSPQWMPLIDVRDFEESFVKNLRQIVEKAEKTEDKVNSFISYTAPFLEYLSLAPIILTESALLYLSRSQPGFFPSKRSRRVVRGTAWMILAYIGYTFYADAQVAEEAPHKRVVILEKFLYEQGQGNKKLSAEMLSTEATKLIYLIEEALSLSLSQLGQKVADKCDVIGDLL